MCVVIGDGSTFVVDIDDRKKVAHLKDMIREKMLITHQLTLYVAKKDGKWITTNDPDVRMLKNGKGPIGINGIMKEENKMDPNFRISNPAFNFPDDDFAGEDEIHILVDARGGWGSLLLTPPTRKRRWDLLY